MKIIYQHINKYVLRGLLALIPLGLTIFILIFAYDLIDRRILDVFDQIIGFRIPGLGIALLLFMLYVVGFITSNIIVRRLVDLFEGVINRIPLIKTTYHIGKQLVSTLSLPEKNVFKKVVLVNYFRPDVWTIGFITGTLWNENKNEKLIKVFIPTVPNPTSGMLVLLKESQTFIPGWSVEEAMKMVVSGGIIGPEQISASLRKDHEV